MFPDDCMIVGYVCNLTWVGLTPHTHTHTHTHTHAHKFRMQTFLQQIQERTQFLQQTHLAWSAKAQTISAACLLGSVSGWMWFVDLSKWATSRFRAASLALVWAARSGLLCERKWKWYLTCRHLWVRAGVNKQPWRLCGQQGQGSCVKGNKNGIWLVDVCECARLQTSNRGVCVGSKFRAPVWKEIEMVSDL